MQLQTITEKLAIAESLLQCTGDKKQGKHRLEYRSYNELIKECLKQEEIKDKLNSKIDDLLHVKFSLNTNISQLKEEIKSLEETLSAKDALHQHPTPRFDLEVHIRSLKSQLNDEYQERNNYLLQLQSANEQINSQSRREKTLLDDISKMDKKNHDLKAENMDLILKINHLQQQDPFTTIDAYTPSEPPDDSIVSLSNGQYAGNSALKNRSQPASSAWDEYNMLLRKKDLPYSMVVDKQHIISENNNNQHVTRRDSNTRPDNHNRTGPENRNPTRPDNRNPSRPENDINIPVNDRDGYRHQSNQWQKVTARRRSVHRNKLSNRGPRPICKWFQQGTCHSQYCIYDHKYTSSRTDTPTRESISNTPQPVTRTNNPDRNTHRRYNSETASSHHAY